MRRKETRTIRRTRVQCQHVDDTYLKTKNYCHTKVSLASLIRDIFYQIVFNRFMYLHEKRTKPAFSRIFDDPIKRNLLFPYLSIIIQFKKCDFRVII